MKNPKIIYTGNLGGFTWATIWGIILSAFTLGLLLVVILPYVQIKYIIKNLEIVYSDTEQESK